MIDLVRSMQMFVAVVDKGSFASAAEYLDASTAAVSRYVSALESHLGVRLLNRTTRRLSLTDSGHEFYSRAQLILADIADAEAVAGQQALQPKGLLRISAPVSYGIHELGRLLPGFRQRFPELQLDIDLSDRFVDLVNDGIDVAMSRSVLSAWILTSCAVIYRMVIGQRRCIAGGDMGFAVLVSPCRLQP